MITLRGISKSFGAQTLLEDVSLQINMGDRFALVGPNGAGKSTLFKVIMGLEPPDNGELALRSGVRFGYLPQETPHLSGHPVLEETIGADNHDNRREAQAKKILMGLGFKITDFERPVSELSGGWQMRVMIAKLLLDEPDLLMLDEPTNHLDLESLLWFQRHLTEYRGAIFLISHDREFINAVTNRIVEVRNSKLNLYNGSFEDYLAQRKQEELNLLNAYKRQQKEIEDLEIFISRFRAKASLAASVQSKIKYLERMERIELPPDQKTVGFSFPQPARSGHNVLVLKNIRQSYDGVRYIYDGLDLTLERGQKIALVGPNGAGKSTLLKLLAGQLSFQSGERKPGFDVEVGYFSQHRAQMFKPGRNVFEEACDTRRAHSETTIRTILGSFLFQGEMVFKKVEVLSGGEKSRLGLVKLLLDPPNLLLMDEPTTHLDIASVERLLEAIKDFGGTLCVISHDVYFLKQLVDNVIHVDQGKITHYPGGYDYFLHKKSLEEGEEAELFRSEEQIEQSHSKTSPHPALSLKGEGAPRSGAGEGKGGGSGRKTKEQKRKEAEERNAKYRQKQQGESSLSPEEQLKQEEQTILAALADPATHKDHNHVTNLTKKLGEIQKKLKGLAVLLFLALTPACLNAAPAYVQSAWVEVRKSASPSAPVLAKLRVNTMVEAAPLSSGWSKIQYRTALNGVEGFVKSSSLGLTAISFDKARETAEKARTQGNKAKAEAWAEIAANIPSLQNPNHKNPRPLLIGACLPKNNQEIPTSAAQRVVLLVEYSAQRGLESLAQTEVNESTLTAKLRELVPRLDEENWFMMTPGGNSHPLQGTPFFGALIPSAENSKIVLGSCESPGTLISNQPLKYNNKPQRDPERSVVLERSIRFPDQKESLEVINISSFVAQKEVFEDIFFKVGIFEKEEPLGFWALVRSSSLLTVYQVGSYSAPSSFTSAYANTWADAMWTDVKFVLVPYVIEAPEAGAGHRVFVASIDSAGATRSANVIIDIFQQK